MAFKRDLRTTEGGTILLLSRPPVVIKMFQTVSLMVMNILVCFLLLVIDHNPGYKSLPG